MARASGSDDPFTAALISGAGLTEAEIAVLVNRLDSEGTVAHLGGVAAATWARKIARQESERLCAGDCEDVGWYGVTDPDDVGIVYGLVRASGTDYEHWTPTGWRSFKENVDLSVLDLDTAQFVSDALAEGCDGVYLHPGQPEAMLEAVVVTAGVSDWYNKKGAWDESKHKRGKGGKFASKDGGGASAESKAKTSAWRKGKEAISTEEAKLRLAEEEAKGEEKKAEGAAAAEQEKAVSGLRNKFEKLIKDGMDPVEAEASLADEMADVSRAGKLKSGELKGKSEARKIEYARQRAYLRLLRLKHQTKKPVTSAAGVDEGIIYAVVDRLDPNAVMKLIRLLPGPKAQKWENGDWVDDPDTMAALRGVMPPPLVELDDAQVESILKQMDAKKGGGKPKPGEKPEKEPEPVAAAMSPDPNAAKLRAYWVSGKGRLKIKWGSPGDFTRCVRHLRKYLPERQLKGYCANLHKLATGMWPGDRKNRGVRGTGASPDVLWDAFLVGGWHRVSGRKGAGMYLAPGVYAEVEDDMMSALTAGATFPVAPPDDWFQNPGLKGPTPLTVDDTGRVWGHIATFDVPHIGMPGKVHAPKSRSGYTYFKTGVLRTESGADLNVGQLTLAGGHAPLHADAAVAVKHYDDTASAVADVNVGEDRYGVWVSGALRPEVTPEQVRTLRASAPSGDWRPINGNLELVAVCQVNVPGFPVARVSVAASGAITAMVAAGARPLARQKMMLMADAALEERMSQVERLVLGDAAVDTAVDTEATEETEPTEVEAPAEVEAEASAEAEADGEVEVSESIQRVRNYITEQRLVRIRERVAATREASKAITLVAGGKSLSTESRETAAKKGFALPDGSYPIRDKVELGKAIQSFGRAKDKAATKKHIIKRAKALGASDMIPEDWKK